MIWVIDNRIKHLARLWSLALPNLRGYQRKKEAEKMRNGLRANPII